MVFINDLGMNIERKFIPYYLLESDNNNYNYFLKKGQFEYCIRNYGISNLC
ncbi:MAG: hypothetical protein L6U99_08595 [Clostridium sp.]|nr:MAG: hypothetical protein L6U99_08595 [Clostridium sp.]